MKKPVAQQEPVTYPMAKLIFKIQKENTPVSTKLQPMDALQLARTAAQHQQLRVTKLIQ